MSALVGRQERPCCLGDVAIQPRGQLEPPSPLFGVVDRHHQVLRGAGRIGQIVGKSDGDASATAVDRRARVTARLATTPILTGDSGCTRIRSILIGMDEKRDDGKNNHPFGYTQLCFLSNNDVSIP